IGLGALELREDLRPLRSRDRDAPLLAPHGEERVLQIRAKLLTNPYDRVPSTTKRARKLVGPGDEPRSRIGQSARRLEEILEHVDNEQDVARVDGLLRHRSSLHELQRAGTSRTILPLDACSSSKYT